MPHRFDFNRVAFVASGGGFKALGWHIGVAMALKEYGFAVVPRTERQQKKQYHPIDHVIGSSGGAIFAAIVANGFSEETVMELDRKPLLSYFLPLRNGSSPHITDFSYTDVFKPNIPSLGQLWRMCTEMLNIPRIMQKYGPGFGIEALLRELLKSRGFFNLEKLESFFSKALPINDFQQLYDQNLIDLHIIATEVNNPRKAIFGRHSSDWIGTSEDNFYRDRFISGVPISKAVVASSSIVPIYSPTIIDGVAYFDGEVKQSLSVHLASDFKADLVIVSHTFKPYIYDPAMGELNDLFSLVMQELYTSIYQKINSPKKFHLAKKRVYERISSPEFRKEYGLSKAKQKQMVEEICDVMLFDPKRTFIYISSPTELFFMDHFNLLSYANREIMSAGYYRARQIMDAHGFKRLKQCEGRGILDRRDLKRFRFPNTDYEKYRQRMKRHIPDYS